TVTALEDVAYQFKISDFPFSDSDGNNLFAVKVASLPGSGTLRDNGTAVTLNQFIPFVDIATGRFTYTAPANQFGSPQTTFTFQVQDDGGVLNGGVDLSTAATMTVNVTSLNDAPAGADKTVNIQATPTSAAYTFAQADFGFTDTSDSPANTLTAVVISSLPA